MFFFWQATMCAGQCPCVQHAAPLQSCPKQAFNVMHQSNISSLGSMSNNDTAISHLKATGIADIIELNTLLIRMFVSLEAEDSCVFCLERFMSLCRVYVHSQTAF